MSDYLSRILAQKEKEVAVVKHYLENHTVSDLARRVRGEIHRAKATTFKEALTCQGLSVIGEIKRASPSRGYLAEIPDPGLLAKTYISGGARAISVLTDELFFRGSLEDLRQVRAAIHAPILRKEFVIDKIQIAQSVEVGADAILLIVSVLKERIREFLDYAAEFGIEALVEINSLEELEIAVQAGAEMILVNHRNLLTFDVDIELSARMKAQIPDRIIKVAASGLESPDKARGCYQEGFDAVLIGEALVTSSAPEQFIRKCG